MSHARVEVPAEALVLPEQSGLTGRPMAVDRARLRADTPACERIGHLNNAGASLPPRPVTERVVRHLRLEEEIGAYEAAETVAEEWEAGRESLAELLGTDAANVAIVESTTVGLHRVLSTIPLRRGDRVIVASSEYASTVLPLLQLSRRVGLRVEHVPDGEDGTVDTAALSRMLADDVRLVCAVQAPSHNGLVNDVAAIGATLRRSGSSAWYLVDACQSVGQLPVDTRAIGADFLVASGRKFLRGPRGTGVLIAGDRALAELDAFPVDTHGATWDRPDGYTLAHNATRYETYERSVALGLGLMTAARYAQETGIEAIRDAIGRHAQYLRAHIGALPGWSVLDRGWQNSGIVTARHDRVPAAEMVARLREQRINGYAVSPMMNPRDLGSEAVLRLSPHAFNSPDELDRALAVLAAV